LIVEVLLVSEAQQRFYDHGSSGVDRCSTLERHHTDGRGRFASTPGEGKNLGIIVDPSGGPVNTRTIAILALIIAVIVILILVL
jgi:hypothetical protein